MQRRLLWPASSFTRGESMPACQVLRTVSHLTGPDQGILILEMEIALCDELEGLQLSRLELSQQSSDRWILSTIPLSDKKGKNEEEKK